MTNSVRPDHRHDDSPARLARIAGVLYAIVTVTALFAEIGVRSRLITFGDPNRTVTNIITRAPLYRLGAGADITAFLCDIGIAVLLFRLLQPVSRTLSLTAAFFRSAHATIAALNTINYIAPLIFLGGGVALAATTGSQDLVMASLRLHGVGYNVALLFFGVHCVLCGYLIVRSTFLPRPLGVLLAIAGVCYLINGYSAIVAPEFKRAIYPYVLIPAGLGEWSLMIWLLMARVNRERWYAMNSG